MHIALGNALLDAPGEIDRAIAAFRRASVLKPNDFAACHNLGLALAKKGNRDEAVAALRRAVELAPIAVPIAILLHTTLLDLGQFELAVACSQRVLDHSRTGTSLSKTDRSLLLHSLVYAKVLVEYDQQLPAVLRGETSPANARDALMLAQVCMFKQRYGDCARFYEEAFQAQATLQTSPHLLAAACAAVKASYGQGKDDQPLEDGERVRWRKQALVWMRTDLTAQRKLLASNVVNAPVRVERSLRHWREAAELSSLRDLEQLARLPRDEQAAWLGAWLEVETLLQQVTKKDR